jgi:poly(A) polymerase
MSIPQDQIDPDAQKVVRRLTRSGFSAYLVGGCVRDLLLGRTPKDFDVATNATPPEIKALFRNCRIIGRRFRLAHVFFGAKIIETSTFRANPREVLEEERSSSTTSWSNDEGALELDAETETELLIRRDNVFGTAEEDALRRDFTINGLFYDLDSNHVIDYVSGLPDLERRTVRTIGEPEIRFQEDPIRILRAIKFAARLDFQIEESAYQAILRRKGEIAKCAPPRVLEEIYRLFRGGAGRRSLEILRASTVLEVLIPDLARLLGPEGDHEGAVLLHSALEALDRRVQEGFSPSNALLLSLLITPFLRDVLYEREGAEPIRDAPSLVEELSRPMLESIRASRRDVEKVRQILLAQRRLGVSKKRRTRPMALVRRDWFAEALALIELMHPEPEAELTDEIGRWHRLLRDGGSSGEGAQEGGPPGGDPKRRRRRRRGGRRRQGVSSTGGESVGLAKAEP